MRNYLVPLMSFSVLLTLTAICVGQPNTGGNPSGTPCFKIPTEPADCFVNEVLCLDQCGGCDQKFNTIPKLVSQCTPIELGETGRTFCSQETVGDQQDQVCASRMTCISGTDFCPSGAVKCALGVHLEPLFIGPPVLMGNQCPQE